MTPERIGGSARLPSGISVGVLALQGDFAAHAKALALPGVDVREVRRRRDLEGLSGLALPGGESTTLLKLMELERLDEALVEFHGRGGHLFGTCAGLILLAQRVSAPAQRSLGLLDVAVERNAFGRQAESFVDTGEIWLEGSPASVEMVFIRAPRIREVGQAVSVRGTWKGEPVLVESGRLLGATFHPELSPGAPVHRYFVEKIRASRAGEKASAVA